MASFNRIQMIGRLTKDPEQKFSDKGTSIVNFDLACDIGFGDSKKPLFIGVVAFGKTGDFVKQYFSKGKEILIEGSLDYQTWEEKDSGKKRSKHAIIANQVHFVGSKKDDSATQTETKPVDVESDIPF